MNTNDPDYEHIYSIEDYDDPLDELLYFPPAANLTNGIGLGLESFHFRNGAGGVE